MLDCSAAVGLTAATLSFRAAVEQLHFADDGRDQRASFDLVARCK
jgi:hypothetical protein